MKSVENKCVANDWFLVLNAKRCDNLELDGSTKLAALFETRGKWGLGVTTSQPGLKSLGSSEFGKNKGKSEPAVDI